MFTPTEPDVIYATLSTGKIQIYITDQIKEGEANETHSTVPKTTNPKINFTTKRKPTTQENIKLGFKL
jgi:hypothetical protein